MSNDSSLTTNNGLFKRLIKPVSDGFRGISEAMKPISEAAVNVVESTESLGKATAKSLLSSVPIIASSPTSQSSGIFSFVENWSWKFWILIILVFAFFGFNVFTALASGTNEVTGIVKPLLKLITYLTLEFTKHVTNLLASLSIGGITAVNTTVTTAVDTVENAAQSGGGSATGDSIVSSLTRAKNANSGDVGYDDASSSIQSGSKLGQAGFCYIGQDVNHVRGCMEISAQDRCMSGDVYPTRDICINPSLRA